MEAPRPERFMLFEAPAGDALDLCRTPALASWDKKGSASQVHLSDFLTHVDEVVGRTTPVGNQLALSLDVGLPVMTNLVKQNDLDNYLDGVGRRVLRERVVSIWGAKRHAEHSVLRLGEAFPMPREQLVDWAFASARPLGSYEKIAWKRQIAAAVRDHVAPPPEDPLEMHVAFRIGLRRNWISLWKPAIDGLTPILGATRPDREFHPRDDRIVRLSLHLREDPAFVHDVEVGFWWRTAVASRS